MPIAARVSQLAEFVEVAHRSGGVDAAVALARRLAGSQFDPNIADALRCRGRHILDGLDQASTWDEVIAAEPVLSPARWRVELDDALGASPTSSTSSRRTRSATPVVWPSWSTAAGAQLGLDAEAADDAAPGGRSRTGSAGSACPTRSGTSAGPLGAGEWERVRLQPYLTERMLQQSPVAARHRCARRAAPRAARRLRVSAWPLRRRDRAAGAHPGRRRRVPGDGRAAAPPAGSHSATTAAAELRAEVRAGRLDGDAVEAVLVAAGHRATAAPGPAGRAHRPRDRRAAAASRGACRARRSPPSW